MQQTGDFSYEEGDRKARASKATMDADQNLILLDTGARMWDATGSTLADHIRLDQRTGDFQADGNVNSSRLPDKDQKKNSEMLSGDDPLQATARKMESRDHNRQIHYEGAVQMWQGANRIQADVVDVDRNLDPQKRTLVADGHVVTNLWDEPKDDKKKKAANPVLTEVHAAHMVYTEATRVTHYTGGVQSEPSGTSGQGAGAARVPQRSRRRFSPRQGFRRWRGGNLLHREGPHAHRHRRARRILHGGPEGDPARPLGSHGGEVVHSYAAQHYGRQGSHLLR